MLVFAKFAFNFDLAFFSFCSIITQKLTYLYQEFDRIAISSWFRFEITEIIDIILISAKNELTLGVA